MNKNKISNKRNTLDKYHNDKIKHFENINKSLPNKEKKLQKYILELDKLNKKNIQKYTENDFSRKTFLYDAIEQLNDEIYDIKSEKENLRYIRDTMPILINYYDKTKNNKCDYYDIDVNDKSNVMSYFMKDTKQKKVVNNECSKSELYGKYRRIIENDPDTKIDVYKCREKNCDGNRIINEMTGCLVCTNCGFTEQYVLKLDKTNYKEPIQDTGYYAYKRKNHLTEILSIL